MSSPAALPVRKAPSSWRTRLRHPLSKVALALLAPLTFFATLEFGLRIFGVGHSARFFIPDGADGIYRTNPRFTETYFPASFGLKPLNFRLPKVKPPGAARIFVLGESAAMGVPEPGFGLAPQLRAQLRAAFPDRPIEVFNLGVTAINSHVITAIAAEALDFHPDALVVYVGNNEVVGPYGPGSTLTQSVPPRGLVRVSVWARQLRLGQVLHRTWTRFASDRGYHEWRGMETFSGKQVRADDPRLEVAYAHFAENLSEILDRATAAGVPVVVSTVAVNTSHSAPFASVPLTGANAPEEKSWRDAVERGVQAWERDDPHGAEEAWREALRRHPAHAETHFRLAGLLAKTGDVAGASEHEAEALRWDALRFRADARINAIIREQARARSPAVRLVDSAETFARLPADARRTLFFEHVHLSFEGNFALARSLAPAVAHVLGGGASDWLELTEAASALGFTDAGRLMMLLAMDELTARPPFTQQYTYAEDRTRLKGEIASLNAQVSAPGALAGIRATVERSWARDPANLFLGSHLAILEMQTGNVAGALAVLEKVAEQEPPSAERAVRRAFLLQKLGRHPDAEAQLLDVIARDPFYFQSYGLLASLWGSSGQTAKALEFFREKVEHMPASLGVRHMLANLLLDAKESAQAEEQWRIILRIQPDDEAALDALQRRLFSRGREEEAVALLLAAHAYNPKNFGVNARLIQYYQTRNDAQGQAKHMAALAESGPVPATLHLERAALLLRLGQTEERRTELFRARRKAREQNDAATLQAVAGALSGREQ